MQWCIAIAHFAPAPLTRRTRLALAPPSSRTGRNQYHAAGVLVRAQHCSEAAATASRRHRKHDIICKTQWRI